LRQEVAGDFAPGCVESERQKRCLVRAVPAKRLATRKLDLRSFRVAQGVGPTLTGFFKPMGLGIKDFDYMYEKKPNQKVVGGVLPKEEKKAEAEKAEK
jgi:hypothetical protein